MNYKLAVIPGDGIGPEVIGEALKVLDKVARPKLRQGNFEKYSNGSLHPEPWAYPWALATRRSASLPLGSL